MAGPKRRGQRLLRRVSVLTVRLFVAEISRIGHHLHLCTAVYPLSFHLGTVEVSTFACLHVSSQENIPILHV